MNLHDYLKKIFRDASERADSCGHKVFSRNSERFVWTMKSGNRYELSVAGRNLVYKAERAQRGDKAGYSSVFLFRSAFGEYGLVRSVIGPGGGSGGPVQGYRPEYVLNEAHLTAADDCPGYRRLGWNTGWQEFCRENISGCPMHAVVMPGTDREYETVFA